MLRRFEATARNLSLAFANLERANAPESLHFRQSLNLALRYGPRGDQFYAVASNPAPTENDISLSPCFVKVDTSMRAWTEVNLFATEESVKQVVYESKEQMFNCCFQRLATALKLSYL